MAINHLSVVPRDDQVLVDRLYRLEDAAEFFGFESATWLRKRIKDGSLDYVDMNPNGSRPDYRVSASAMNALIERMTIRAVAV